MLRQQEMLIGTFTIDCHSVMSSMSLSPEEFSLCFLISILVIRTHLCQGFIGSLHKNILYGYKHVPSLFMDTEIDDLSSIVPGLIEWTFTISNKEL